MQKCRERARRLGMNLKQKLDSKRKELSYLISGLYKHKMYINLLKAAGEIQSFSDPVCFRGYPVKQDEKTCPRFDEDNVCKGESCPLFGFNKDYIKAKKDFDDARIAVYKAQTALVCSKIKE